jgi:hypothetical protein
LYHILPCFTVSYTYRISLNYTVLHRISPYCTIFHVLEFLYYISLYYTVFHRSISQYFSVFRHRGTFLRLVSPRNTCQG